MMNFAFSIPALPSEYLMFAHQPKSGYPISGFAPGKCRYTELSQDMPSYEIIHFYSSSCTVPLLHSRLSFYMVSNHGRESLNGLRSKLRCRAVRRQSHYTQTPRSTSQSTRSTSNRSMNSTSESKTDYLRASWKVMS